MQKYYASQQLFDTGPLRTSRHECPAYGYIYIYIYTYIHVYIHMHIRARRIICYRPNDKVPSGNPSVKKKTGVIIMAPRRLRITFYSLNKSPCSCISICIYLFLCMYMCAAHVYINLSYLGVCAKTADHIRLT